MLERSHKILLYSLEPKSDTVAVSAVLPREWDWNSR